MPPRRRATYDQAAYADAIAEEVEFLQEQVAALTEHLVWHRQNCTLALEVVVIPPAPQQTALTPSTAEQVVVIPSAPQQTDLLTLSTAEDIELFQQELVASAQREVEPLQQQLDSRTQQLVELVVRAGATTEVVKPLQEQIAALTKQLATLPAPAPQQATPAAAATAEDAKLLQEQVVALTQQLAALAAPSPTPSDSESDNDNQYQAVNEHTPIEPENHTYQSQRIQPNDPRTSNFIKTITTIFKKKRIKVPISIFKLPNSVISAKPEAYAPKLVGLGPLHHLRPELQHIQMYKVMEAKRIHDGFESDLTLDKVIVYIKQLAGPSIRTSYSIYLDMEDDDLAGVMAIDGLFLLDFLCCYGIGEEVNSAKSSYFRHLVNSAGRRLPQSTIIQEAMMLENQIPIFVLMVILITECSEFTGQKMILSHIFPKILIGFCESFSPLKTVENYPRYKALKHAHLLDLLYHLVILKQSPEWNSQEEHKEWKSLERLSKKVRPLEPEYPMERSAIDKNKEFIESAYNVIKTFAPVQAVPHIQLVKSLFDEIPHARSIISARAKEEVPAKKTFLFPTASELDKVGVKFSNKADHITDISFDLNTFYLPSIKIEANFEVVIRNLIAYEAMIKSDKEPPILNWYVELMNGLIETAEDVGVLKDQGIILKPEFIDDEQVAKIFNGMNKSVDLINIPENLNNAIKSVRDHYTREKKALEDTFMEKCRRTVKAWFRIFAILLALFLLIVQTVCSVYECRRFSFKTSNASPVEQVLPLPSLRSHLM